mgnify:CR=1 FL=1
MFYSFFESAKHVGLLLPVALLRVFFGIYYFQQATAKYTGDYLVRPRLAAMAQEWLPLSEAPQQYKYFVETIVIPNWQIFAWSITGAEFLIAVSFLLGYLVRPAALLGIFLSLNLLAISGPASEDFFRSMLAVHLMLGWIGAGRCLGIDYWFYKRNRGLWW